MPTPPISHPTPRRAHSVRFSTCMDRIRPTTTCRCPSRSQSRSGSASCCRRSFSTPSTIRCSPGRQAATTCSRLPSGLPTTVTVPETSKSGRTSSFEVSVSPLSISEPCIISRRQLGRCAALAAAGAVGVPETAQSPALPGNQTAVDAKYANALRKYGDRLSEGQRTRVRETIAGHERMLAHIRNFPLESGDQPATGFRL